MSFLHKIPFLRVLLPFIVGIITAILHEGNHNYWQIVSSLYLISLLLYFVLTNKAATVWKLLFGLFGQLFFAFSGYFICQLNNAKNELTNYTNYVKDSTQIFYGYVSDIPAEKPKSIKAEITLTSIGEGKTVSGKLIAYLQKNEKSKRLEIGTHIAFKGKLQEIQAPLNPHEFNYKAYLKNKNIFHSVYLKEDNWLIYQVDKGFSLFAFSQKLRKYLLDIYRNSGLEKREFAMIAALVLGYDDEIDQPTMNAYSHTGTLHVLSVSGLHVGLIYMLLGYMLAFLDRNKKTTWLKVFLIVLILWFFVLLSGFSAPAVRAAFMFSLMLLGKTLFKEVETANIVLVSAFFSLCINPYWLTDVGFQLSYLAVLGIIYLYPFFYNMFSFSYSWGEKLWALSSVSLAAQLATLPITLYYFHQFPLLFLVTNLVVIPISTIVMYAGILLLLLSKIKIIAGALVWATAFLIKVMNASAIYFDSLPFCVIDGINLSFITMIGLYVLLLLVFLSIEEKSFKLLFSSFMLSVILVCLSLFFDWKSKDNHQLIIYQSNQANVLSVFSGNKSTQLTDTIIDDRLKSTLRENKIKNNIVSESNKELSAISLLKVNDKRILFAKNVEGLSDELISFEKPDFIWIPAQSLKSKRTPKFLIPYKNVIISGKISERKTTNNFYLTSKQGAFVLSLPK